MPQLAAGAPRPRPRASVTGGWVEPAGAAFAAAGHLECARERCGFLPAAVEDIVTRVMESGEHRRRGAQPGLVRALRRAAEGGADVIQVTARENAIDLLHAEHTLTLFGGHEEASYGVVANKITIAKRHMEFTLRFVPVLVAPHLVTRYIERTGRGPADLLGTGLSDAVRLGALLALSAGPEVAECALPLGDGLLAGHTRAFKNHRLDFVTRSDATGYRHREVPSPVTGDGYSVVLNLRTYIGAHQLGASQREDRAITESFLTWRRREVRAAFDAIFLGQSGPADLAEAREAAGEVLAELGRIPAGRRAGG